MAILRRNDLVALVFSGLFLIAVIIIALIALGRIEAQTRANFREALQTVLETTQEALHIWIEQRRRNVLELASLPEVRELTQALLSESKTGTALIESPHLEKIRGFMRPRLNKYSDQGFFIISPKMINIASMRNENLGKLNLIYQQRPGHMERLFQGHVTFVPTITSDVPLRDRQCRSGAI